MLGRRLFEAAVGAEAGVGERDVQAAVGGQRLRGHPLLVGPLVHVAGDGKAVERLRHGARTLGVPVGNDDAGTLGGEPPPDGLADPAPTPVMTATFLPVSHYEPPFTSGYPRRRSGMGRPGAKRAAQAARR